jgi:hypothetical protein
MMTIKQRMLSATLSMLCALIVVGALQVHAQESPLIHLSDEDKSAIVESVLRQEFMVQGEEFRGLMVSSENLEFIDPSEISRLGLRLINRRPSYGQSEYLVFRRIAASGNNAMVTLSRVVEEHRCFGPTSSREQTFVYQYHIESGRWTGELIRKTPRPLRDSTQWSRATGALFRIKGAP